MHSWARNLLLDADGVSAGLESVRVYVGVRFVRARWIRIPNGMPVPVILSHLTKHLLSLQPPRNRFLNLHQSGHVCFFGVEAPGDTLKRMGFAVNMEIPFRRMKVSRYLHRSPQHRPEQFPSENGGRTGRSPISIHTGLLKRGSTRGYATSSGSEGARSDIQEHAQAL